MTAVYHYILLDRSGSMGTRWVEALSSCNAYVKELDGEDRITIDVFDAMTAMEYINVRDSLVSDFKSVSDADCTPRGGTPLLDAVGRVVAKIEASNAEKAVLVVITDGEENSSREITKDGAKAALDRLRAKGYQVLFIGADFDNFHQAAGVGTARGQTISANSADLSSVMASTARVTRSYKAWKGEGVAAQMVNYDDDDFEAVKRKA